MRVISDYIPVSVVAPLFKNFVSSGGPHPIFELLGAVQRLRIQPQYVDFSGDVALPVDLPIAWGGEEHYLHPTMYLFWHGPKKEYMRVMVSRVEINDEQKRAEIFRTICDTVFVCPEIVTIAEEWDENCRARGYVAYFPKNTVRFRQVPKWEDNSFEIVEKPDLIEKGENIYFHFGYTEGQSCSRVWLRGKGLKPLAIWLKENVPSMNIFLNGDFYWEGSDYVDGKFIILTDEDRTDRATFQKKVQPYKDAVMPYLQRKGLSPKTMGAGGIFGAVEGLYKKGVTNLALNALFAIAVGECGNTAFAMMMTPVIRNQEEGDRYFSRQEREQVENMTHNYDLIRPWLEPGLIRLLIALLKRGEMPKSPPKNVTIAFAQKMFELFGKGGDLAALNRAYEKGDLSAVAIKA